MRVTILGLIVLTYEFPNPEISRISAKKTRRVKCGTDRAFKVMETES